MDKPVKTKELQNAHVDSTIWEDFKFREDDIFVCTWPKAGTTFVQQIIAQLVLGPDPDLEVAAISPWVEFRLPGKEVKLPQIEAITNRRFLKSHLPLDALIFNEKAKYICVGRDGRDVLWSLHAHHKNFKEETYKRLNEAPNLVGPPFEPPTEDIHQYYTEWMEKDGYPIWSFFDYALSWWKYKHLSNILFVHFADLKKDPDGEIRRIAAFLDVKIDEETFPKVLEYCSFDFMKANGTKYVPLGGGHFKDPNAFINKGKNKCWKDVLSEKEVATYETTAKERLGKDCANWLANGGHP